MSNKRITVDPAVFTIFVSKSVTLTAMVSGLDDQTVNWSVVESNGCGSIGATGGYTAPATLPNPAVCHARATSAADASIFGESRLLITSQAGGGPPGVWTNVPIAGIQYFADSGGAQTVVVDPVRPSDFYAFVSPADNMRTWVMKSTDYGLNWKDVNKTEFSGTPWGGAIDPNPKRDPNTPPTLWCPAGFGSNGAWKSTDGGVTWKNMVADQKLYEQYTPYGAVDAYGIVVLPDDPPNHVAFTYHYGFKPPPGGAPQGFDGGLFESKDGGNTWQVHLPPAGFGNSHYLIPIDAQTWLMIAQEANGKNGMWRTETAGRVNGQINTAAWKRVDDLEHSHGAFQPYIDPKNGAIYIPGLHGTKRSTDRGLTWQYVHMNGNFVSSVVATDRFLYCNTRPGPALLRAPRADGMPWTPYTPEPMGMIGAPPYGTATSFDGQHWIIVQGGHVSGLWRYVEP
jgi:hypothetical protein